MPSVTATASTYNVVGNREHLMDAIYRVAQEDAPFTTQICSRTTAEAKLVEWQTDDLRAPNAANAVVEGADAPAATSQMTARVGNRTQLFNETAQTSSTQRKVKSAGRSDEMKRQLAIKSKLVLLDIEAAALSSSNAVAGDASTTASRMRGLESWLQTNISHGGSGSTTGGVVTDGTQRAVTKALVDSMLQQVFAKGSKVDTIMVGASNKRALSGVLNGAAVSNRQVAAEKKTVADAVDVYISDYGTIKIMPNRTQRDRTLFGLNDDMHAMAFLQSIQTVELAKTGNSDKELVFAEATYVCKNEAANGKVADLTTP